MTAKTWSHSRLQECYSSATLHEELSVAAASVQTAAGTLKKNKKTKKTGEVSTMIWLKQSEFMRWEICSSLKRRLVVPQTTAIAFGHCVCCRWASQVAEVVGTVEQEQEQKKKKKARKKEERKKRRKKDDNTGVSITLKGTAYAFLWFCFSCLSVRGNHISPFIEWLLDKLNLLPHVRAKHQHLLFSVNYTLWKR